MDVICELIEANKFERFTRILNATFNPITS